MLWDLLKVKWIHLSTTLLFFSCYFSYPSSWKHSNTLSLDYASYSLVFFQSTNLRPLRTNTIIYIADSVFYIYIIFWLFLFAHCLENVCLIDGTETSNSTKRTLMSPARIVMKIVVMVISVKFDRKTQIDYSKTITTCRREMLQWEMFAKVINRSAAKGTCKLL